MPTKIEWAQETWSPVTGCTKISEGCEHCYAERMAKRLRGRCGYPADDPFRVTLHPERIDKPLRWRKPRTIFVCSMGDLFHEDAPREWQRRIFAGPIHNSPQHRFLILTKRPDRMLDFIEWYITCVGTFAAYMREYRHVGLGVTVESQDHEDRIAHLLACPAAMRFASVEPMLEGMDLRVGEGTGGASLGLHGLDWVIAGGESGPGARPMEPQWPRDLRDQCVEAGVPYFFKQWGGANKKRAGRELDGRTWDQRPAWFGEAAKEKDDE